MKIALIGYGKMGKEIEKIALSRGHQIVSIIDLNNYPCFGFSGGGPKEMGLFFIIYIIVDC